MKFWQGIYLMEQGNITVLNENSWGIRLVKTDLKKRSRVDVVNKYGEKLATYRFNNIPLYENQYMSWQNLDCCDGWMHDEDYLLTAVQEGKKLVAGIYVNSVDIREIQDKLKALENSIDDAKECFEIVDKHTNGEMLFVGTIIARKGTLADFYDIDEIIAAYKMQGIDVDKDRLDEYFHVELKVLFSGDYKAFDYGDPQSATELIVCGLGLGYPLESTAHILSR